LSKSHFIIPVIIAKNDKRYCQSLSSIAVV
jgi:hypothetical protein